MSIIIFFIFQEPFSKFITLSLRYNDDDHNADDDYNIFWLFML